MNTVTINYVPPAVAPGEPLSPQACTCITHGKSYTVRAGRNEGIPQDAAEYICSQVPGASIEPAAAKAVSPKES